MQGEVPCGERIANARFVRSASATDRFAARFRVGGAPLALIDRLKRLHVHDPLMSFVSVGGANLGAISVGLQLGSAHGQQSAILRELGANLEQLPERTATRAVEALGLSRSEAEKIAHRPCRRLICLLRVTASEQIRSPRRSKLTNLSQGPTNA